MTKWAVEWCVPCTHHVQSMHWRLAGDICAAIYDAAATGSGHIERIKASDPNLIRIRIQGAAADVRIEHETRSLVVLRVFKTG
ncbi:hypothetical protein [Polyangium aurulentum]|uniref:hypothetical protein n=1 Tax=Polyangium aurulentum TaxID=2567896 RepID=UPI0010ADDFD1|nr:hypothetical protein [Polyangium aurulentum]UQA59437.1 hypothetical protein E8A73_002710 [Polyangium aurulentum]